MTPEQQAVIEVVQNDVRGAIDFLLKPCMRGMANINQALEHLRSARNILDSLILNSGTPPAKEETISQLLRDIAIKDRENPK